MTDQKSITTTTTQSVFGLLLVGMRFVLGLFSICVLVVALRLTSMRFNVKELLQSDLKWIVEQYSLQQLTVIQNVLVVDDDSGSTSSSSSALWYPFLYGELTFSLLIPLGVHGLLTSTRRVQDVTQSVSTFMFLAVILGLFFAHRSMDGVIRDSYKDNNDEEEEQEMNPFERMVGRNKLLVMATLSFVLSYILVFDEFAKMLKGKIQQQQQQQQSTDVTSSQQKNRTTPPNKEEDGAIVYYMYQLVRCLVKASGAFNVVVGCLVLYMGCYSNGPSDMIPKLKWGNYDLVATYGQETVYSNEFYYVVVCIMIGTITQTLVVGLATVFSPIWSSSSSDAMNYSMIGVTLIIVANTITMAIYGDDFKAGSDCMSAHIIQLAMANGYIPIVWWIHKAWLNSNYNVHGLENDTQSTQTTASVQGDEDGDDDKEKEE